MRRFVVVLAIVTGIVSICVFSLLHILHTRDKVEVYSGAIFAAIESGDSDALAHEVEALTDYWHEREGQISRYVRHTQVDEVTKSVSKLNSYVMFEDYTSLHAELSVIHWQMEHIFRSEQPVLSNLL